MKVNTLQYRIAEEQRKLENHLEKNGLKLSTGRRKVFKVVMDAHGHFTPEEIVKRCKVSKNRVSRATIYRSLNELLEAGIIRTTAFGEKHQHFEHIYDEKQHHHAKCIKCHQYIEFPDLGEDKVYKPILERKGFRIIGHEMHFYGICKKCNGRH